MSAVFENKNIYITGGNRGIGKAVSKMFASEKANISLIGRSFSKDLEAELLAAGALSVKFYETDLSSRDEIERLIEKLKDQKVDVLFNNAGLLTGGLLEEQPLDDIYDMFQVNIVGLTHLTRGVLPQMLKEKSGLIINNSSVSALMHFPCATTYAASKAALYAFSNCLNAELEGTGVSVLCLVTPGIKTRMFDEIEVKYGKNFETPTDSITPEEYADQIKQSILSGQKVLWPKGPTRLGLFIARFLPSLFRREINRRFRR